VITLSRAVQFPRVVSLPAPRLGATQSALAAAALLWAAAIGAALAFQMQLGVGLLLAVCYGPIALYRPDVGVMLFVPMIFLEALPALNLGGKAGGLVIAVAWFGTARRGDIDVVGFVKRNRRMVEVLVVLLLWFSLSAAWAKSSSAVGGDLWRWFAVALLFVVVATTLDAERAIKGAVAAFVAGAVLSVVVGYASGMVDTGSSFAHSAQPSRLDGGVGDPNFLAAGVVAALVLAVGLMIVWRGVITRWLILSGCAVLAFGLAASQSRGGLVAAVAVLLAALAVFKGQRIYVAAATLVLVGVLAGFLSTTPDGLQRITSLDPNGGSGRQDLWTVAWRITEDHPLAGAGLNNFETVAGDYTRRPGVLTSVRNIAEDPHVVHNTYLQVLAETGFVGLALFLAFAGACLRTAWLAARRFAAAGNRDMEALTRAVMVAAIGMLVASFFISAGVDKRTWFLLALGPALLALASRGQEAREAAKLYPAP
jgi:O-antigen ligase